MTLTAYSIERAGTTYRTASSQRDCFTTYYCGEISPLHPMLICGRKAILEALCHRISLTASVYPPPESARRDAF